MAKVKTSKAKTTKAKSVKTSVKGISDADFEKVYAEKIIFMARKTCRVIEYYNLEGGDNLFEICKSAVRVLSPFKTTEDLKRIIEVSPSLENGIIKASLPTQLDKMTPIAIENTAKLAMYLDVQTTVQKMAVWIE